MCRHSAANEVLIAILCLGGVAGAADRTWTDRDGRTMQAEFVRELDGEVTFLKSGQLVAVPLSRLSAADQQTVRDLAAGRSVAEIGAARSTGAPAEASTSPVAGPSPANRAAVPIVTRVWTDVFGNQTTAKFVRIFGSDVVLARATKTVTVRYHELTPADQQHIQELLASRGQETQIPPPQPAPVGGPSGAVADSGDAESTADAGFGAPGVAGAPSHPPQPLVVGLPPARFDALEEMRQRTAEIHARMTQPRKQQPAETAAHALASSPSEAPPGVALPAAVAAPSSAAADPPPTDPLAWTPETRAVVRISIFAGLVVTGVLGVFGTILYTAITVASASSVSKQRKYF